MRAWSPLLAASAIACSSSSAGTTPANDAAADAAPRVPKTHRASVTACPTDRPPGSAGPDAGKCSKDADCTEGKNGRCYGGLLPNACSYDECVTDTDCGTAVCDCRNTGKIGQPNVCFKGNCRTDTDCKGQFCSPSATTVTYNCTGPVLGSFGYFCHTAQDECVDNEDCASVSFNAQCVFDPDVVHWKCIKLLCTK